MSSLPMSLAFSTGRSRGFGFVTYKEPESATKAIEATNGMEIDGRNVRVDFSMTRRPHTPTPGEYMGEKRRSGRDRDRGDRDRGDRGDRDRYRRRSRTPPPPRSHGRRSYRSRSRSWSR
ncbi:hypothetical protein NQZ79_g8763 [Umbelopsis isabellina]|nr:hypothetical protein NQZ79_g8763 [Umbelopsis isabellina]